MATPKTTQQLITDHRNRVLSIVMETLDRFDALPQPKSKDNFAMFVYQNSSKLISAMDGSLFEAIRESIENKISMDNDFANALYQAKRDGTLVWEQESNIKYNDLPL